MSAPATHPGFRAVIEDLVKDDGTPDLSLRQLAVLLFLRDEPKANCTIRGMADHLCVPKPAVTRAATRLQDLNFVMRQVDMADRRSVFVRLTVRGRAFAHALPATTDVRELAA